MVQNLFRSSFVRSLVSRQNRSTRRIRRSQSAEWINVRRRWYRYLRKGSTQMVSWFSQYFGLFRPLGLYVIYLFNVNLSILDMSRDKNAIYVIGKVEPGKPRSVGLTSAAIVFVRVVWTIGAAVANSLLRGAASVATRELPSASRRERSWSGVGWNWRQSTIYSEFFFFSQKSENQPDLEWT